METMGIILTEPDPPGIDWDRWVDLARLHPNFLPVPPRKGINPFTKKPMVLKPGPFPDALQIVIEGKQVGGMCRADDGSNSIIVSGERAIVAPLARELARSLGGRFDEFFE